MIAIDLSKQQALYVDPKAIQQVNFTGNLDRGAGAIMFLITEKAKENRLRFFRRNCKIILILIFALI